MFSEQIKALEDRVVAETKKRKAWQNLARVYRDLAKAHELKQPKLIRRAGKQIEKLHEELKKLSSGEE